MKNKTSFLFFLLILCLGSTSAQSTFIDKIKVPPSYGSYISPTDDGGCLVTYAVRNDPTAFYSDGIQILKYDACLQIEWTREYQIPERFLSVDAFLRHSDGHFYIGGRILLDQEYPDLYIFKLNADGNPEFFKTYNKPFTDIIYSLDETTSGDLMIFGNSYVELNNPKNFFLTLNTAGDILSSSVHAEAGIWGRGMACSDGNYLGRMSSRIFKVAPNGDPIWARNYTLIINASAPVEVADGYIFAGSRTSNTFFGSHFLMKLDFDGNLVWLSKGYKSKGYATLELLPNGNILVMDSYTTPDEPEKYEVTLLEFSPEGEQLSNQNVFTAYDQASGLGRDIAIQNDGSVLFSLFSGAGRDTLHVGKSDPNMDFICGEIDNFNEDSIKNVTVEPYSIPNNSITFDTLSFTPERIDITLTAESICQNLDTQFPAPLPDTTICIGEEITIRVNLPGADFEWEDGSTADSLVVSRSGDYELTVSFCGETETIVYQRVTVEDCPCFSAMPNAFTPDGDGKNDIFNLLYNCEVTEFKLDIYNRWGDLVFSSNNAEVGWNGTKNGVPAPMDVYIYRCQYRFGDSDVSELLEEVGDVSLIR